MSITPPNANDPKERTLAIRTYRRIRDDIIAGKHAAGGKLKLERLVSEYDIGMSPLREALFRLVGDALVVSEGQRGFWVAPLSLDDLDDVTAVRALIESQALAEAIQKGDEAWLASIEAAYQALSSVEASLPNDANKLTPELMKEWEAANRVFHESLVSACGSPWLIRFRDVLHQQSARYRGVSLRSSRGSREVHDEHEQIYSAVMRRDVLRACGLIDMHVRRTADEVRKVVQALDEENGDAKPTPRRRTKVRATAK